MSYNIVSILFNFKVHSILKKSLLISTSMYNYPPVAIYLFLSSKSRRRLANDCSLLKCCPDSCWD